MTLEGRVTVRELLTLSGPAAASAVLNNAFRVIDQHAADQLGTPAQAAMGSCVFVLIAAFALHCLVAAGAGPLLARATGAGDLDERRRVFVRSLWGAGAIGLGIAALAAVFAPAMVDLLGLTGETADNALRFLRVLLIGGLPAALGPTVDAAFIAIGRTRAMMALQILAAILNYSGNVLMIHAGYGVGGTAVATIVARSVASGIGLYVLCREFGVGWEHFLDPATRVLREYAGIVRIGMPISVNTLAYSAVYWALLNTAISPLGKEVNAGLGIGFSALEGMSYPVFLGISQAVSSIVGRRLGAGQPDQAIAGAKLAIPWTLGAGALAGVIFYFGATTVCGAFTHDPAVLREAVIYARILGISQPLVALEALAEGVLAGAGVTMPIFLWSMPLNVLRVPLGIMLSARYGAAGIWWGISFTTLIKAAGKGFTALRADWARPFQP